MEGIAKSLNNFETSLSIFVVALEVPDEDVVVEVPSAKLVWDVNIASKVQKMDDPTTSTMFCPTWINMLSGSNIP